MSLTPDAFPFHIRRMRLEDVDAVHEIDRISFTTPWPRRSYLHELTDNPASHLWVAEAPDSEKGPQVAGMIALWLIVDEIHIGTLATHPRYRRRGIARRLLSTALRFALQQSVRTATLEVRPSNVAAQALYAQFGFTVAGRRRAYYHDNNEDALLMTAHNLDPARLAWETGFPQPLDSPHRPQALPEGTPPGGEA